MGFMALAAASAVPWVLLPSAVSAGGDWEQQGTSSLRKSSFNFNSLAIPFVVSTQTTTKLNRAKVIWEGRSSWIRRAGWCPKVSVSSELSLGKPELSLECSCAEAQLAEPCLCCSSSQSSASIARARKVL